jgi:hypothetical protein
MKISSSALSCHISICFDDGEESPLALRDRSGKLKDAGCCKDQLIPDLLLSNLAARPLTEPRRHYKLVTLSDSSAQSASAYFRRGRRWLHRQQLPYEPRWNELRGASVPVLAIGLNFPAMLLPEQSGLLVPT